MIYYYNILIKISQKFINCQTNCFKNDDHFNNGVSCLTGNSKSSLLLSRKQPNDKENSFKTPQKSQKSQKPHKSNSKNSKNSKNSNDSNDSNDSDDDGEDGDDGDGDDEDSDGDGDGDGDGDDDD